MKALGRPFRQNHPDSDQRHSRRDTDPSARQPDTELPRDACNRPDCFGGTRRISRGVAVSQLAPDMSVS